MTSFKRIAVTAAIPALAVLAAGCGSDGANDSAGSSSDGTLTIVASTNVYGDIAQKIAGSDAEVTSIITSSAQDPHEYETTTRDRLAVDDADVVIENGGGYDTFMETLREGADPSAVLTAVDISGLLPEDAEDHSHEEDEEHSEEEEGGHDHVEGFNEHVWYDFHTVEHVAEELASELGDLDPDNAETYQQNYEAFTDQIETLESSEQDLQAKAEGKGVAITEPVPLYLLDAVGLENQTPEAFSEAVEEGTDVALRVLQETLDLFEDDDIALLAYNEQTEDATTEQVQTAAEDSGVPVVDFTETLPEGQGYVEWQQSNLDALDSALDGQ